MQTGFGKKLFLGCLLATGVIPAMAADQAMQPVGIIGAPAGTGAWPAIAESREDLRSHTIYRPGQMPDSPLPVLVWGNGGCSDNGLSHAFFLRELTSCSHYPTLRLLVNKAKNDTGLFAQHLFNFFL